MAETLWDKLGVGMQPPQAASKETQPGSMWDAMDVPLQEDPLAEFVVEDDFEHQLRGLSEQAREDSRLTPMKTFQRGISEVNPARRTQFDATYVKDADKLYGQLHRLYQIGRADMEGRLGDDEVSRLVSRKEREQYLHILAELGSKEPIKRGFLGKLRKQIGRGAVGAAQGVEGTLAEIGSRVLPIEQTREWKEDREFEREALSLKSEVDPAQVENWFGRGLLSAARMAPPMLAAASSGGATKLASARQVGFWYTQTFPSLKDEIKDMGVGDDKATAIAAAFAAPIAAVEVVIRDEQFLAGGGDLAGKSLREGLTSWAKNAVASFGKEWGIEETSQAATEYGAKAFTDWIDEQAELDHGAEVMAKLEELKESALAMPWLMGPGHGARGISDLMEGRRRLPATPERRAELERLKALRAQKFISKADGKAAGLEGDTRKEQRADLEEKITVLEQEEAQEAEDAIQEPKAAEVPAREAPAGREEVGPEVRDEGEVEGEVQVEGRAVPPPQKDHPLDSGLGKVAPPPKKQPPPTKPTKPQKNKGVKPKEPAGEVAAEADVPVNTPDIPEGHTRLTHFTNMRTLHAAMRGEDLDYSKHGTIDSMTDAFGDKAEAESAITSGKVGAFSRKEFGDVVLVIDMPHEEHKARMRVDQSTSRVIPNRYIVGFVEKETGRFVKFGHENPTAPEPVSPPKNQGVKPKEPETPQEPTVKKTAKGYTIKGLSEEQFDAIKEEHGGQRRKGYHYFKRDPSEALTRVTAEAAEEAEQVAAAEASGLVRTRIGTLTPEQAEWYEGERRDRIMLAQEALGQRNEGVEQLLGQFVAKGDRGQFKLALKRASERSDPSVIPKFDEMVEYAKDHPELGLPQDETGLFGLLTEEAFVAEEGALGDRIDDELAAELEQIIEEDESLSFDFGANVEEKPEARQQAIEGFEEEAAAVEEGEQRKAAQKQFESEPAEQQALFGKKGEPGQKNLFADKGVPDDMVAETAAQQAQRKAEEARGKGKARGAGPGGGEISTERIRDDDIPDTIKAPEDQERRLQKAKGMRKMPLMQRIREAVRMARAVTRAQEHIPNTVFFAAANEFFRLLRNVPSMAQDEAILTTAAIADPLGPKQLALLERYTIVENLAASLKLGQPLRFGFQSAEDVETYRSQLEEVVARVPAVQESIETRRKIVNDTVNRLVEYDLLSEEAKENADTYYHQQVHMYMAARGMKGGGTRAGQVGRTFQRRRVLGEALAAEELDYNTSYLESEISWLTDANMEIEKERLLRQLMDKYDSKADLKAKAKRQNFENVVGGPRVAARIDQILGELAESRASEDAQDSAERMRRKQLIEELEDIDPTHPYRKQIAKMAGWFRKTHGLDQDYDEAELDDNEFWAMVKQEADKGDVPALSLFKALHEREDFIRETLGKDYATWESLAEDAEDLTIFQPEPGNQFYRAFTLPERIVEHLQKNVLDTTELSDSDLRQVLAMAGPRRQFVVPNEIAAQLSETRKGEAAHGLARIADEAMRMWKVYTLLNPKRAIPYNLRNTTGDIEPVIASDPALLRHVDRATRELTNYHSGRLQLTPELRAARDFGVVGSGFVAEEVPDLKDLAIFRRFVSQSGKTSLVARPFKAYMDVVKPATQWREDTLRYAAFLGYRQQLMQGRVKHYGGSKKAVVDQIKRDMGVDAAAAHLARNLLGDYGNISVAGNWIRRRLMPFWSFQEINIKRVPRLLVNAYESGGTWRTAGTLSAAAGRAILMSRVAWMLGALWAWNRLVQGGDEEDELAGYDRATPHIILGRNPDGSIRVFRRVGALGDFLEWFGINEAVAMLGKQQAGQVSTQDVLREMAFATPEKVMNSLRPDLKALYELPTGQSLFPEPFQPRSVRRDEAAAQIFGLQDEYQTMKGWALESGHTARPHYWQRWMWGVVDPRNSALSQSYELRSDFLKQKGKESKGVFPVSRYKEARDAAKFEDYGAFVDWKRKFIEEKGDDAKDDFKDWLGTLDPIASRLNDDDELEFETEFLTNEQRGRLTVARNYAHELKDTLIAWWDADEKSSEMKRAVIFTAFRKMDTSPPKREEHDSDAEFRHAQAKFEANNKQAARDIMAMASSHEEAQRLLAESFMGRDEKDDKVTEVQKGKSVVKDSYRDAAWALAELYGVRDRASQQEWLINFRTSDEFIRWREKKITGL